jgi:peptidoglycan hydrolase-like protein with peptidoglycan-binding domain
MHCKYRHPQQRGFSRAAFLTRVNATLFSGKISDSQKEGVNRYLNAWLIYNNVLGKNIPVSWLAYILATVYHETAATMQPIAEYGHGAGYDYGKPDPETGQVYYGRGDVQLTHKVNYEKAQQYVINFNTMKPDLDMVNNPDLALVPWVAAQVTINGMSQGWFTGKSLSDYLTPTATDYYNARRIINGTDKAQTIAAYAVEFEEALHLANGDGIVRSLVQMGSKGDDVREVQLMLRLSPDGVAGSDTTNAIMTFQAKSLLQVDGMCGNDTWLALDTEIYGL